MTDVQVGRPWVGDWNGERYEVQLAPVDGWIVRIWWVERSFCVAVFAPGKHGAEVGLGGDDQVALRSVEALVAAASAIRVGPFGIGGCIDWSQTQGLFEALCSVAAGRRPVGVRARRRAS